MLFVFDIMKNFLAIKKNILKVEIENVDVFHTVPNKQFIEKLRAKLITNTTQSYTPTDSFTLRRDHQGDPNQHNKTLNRLPLF